MVNSYNNSQNKSQITNGRQTLSQSTQRWAALVEYDGSAFQGWQKQTNAHSVQSALELALSKVAGMPIETSCAGRTDKGVHACAQVIHFDCPVERPAKAWIKGGNAWSPHEISVLDAWPVNDDFHARFSAVSRRYRYVIYNHKVAPTWLKKYVSWYYVSLDADKMHEAAQYLVGEHDFTSFRASRCQAKTAVRDMHSIDVKRCGDYITVELKANAFLYHMVRNILGVLIPIGQGDFEPHFAATVLAYKDRSKSLATAQANGLYLTHVEYPEAFGIKINRDLAHFGKF